MLENILIQNKSDFSDIMKFGNRKLFELDFSEKNNDLSFQLVEDRKTLANYIHSILNKNNADIGYGGYFEDRIIYKNSELFGGNKKNSRTIHLGMDFWCSKGEPIFAPFDSTIHSFKNNDNFGDYGPTIILEHSIGQINFYTLYGHLSRNSLEKKKLNQFIKQGEKFAELGDEFENGNWPPHLHFQIIKDLNGNKGDYPGVCTKNEIKKYHENCPDPEIILNINSN